MIEYKEFRSELINEVYSIYEENQWKSYLGDKEKLSRAFEQSLYLLGAFEEGNLVGFVRCIGDSEYILYVQDLIVKPSYYRQGIGKALMAPPELLHPCNFNGNLVHSPPNINF